MACPNVFNILRTREEDLGPTLYVRAAYQDPWLSLIPRDEWPVGTGLVRSTFEVPRSEPSTDEETWVPITTMSGETYVGSCGGTYNDTYLGFKEGTYKPEQFKLRGPLVCQSDLTLHWNSQEFWEKYFQRLEQRNTKSIVNRLENIYGTYATKVSPQADGTVEREAGDTTTQPPGSALSVGTIPLPGCALTQDILDQEAVLLVENGATAPDTMGWITMGPSGAIFPLMIGMEASNQLLLNNADLREDYRRAYDAFADAAPVIQRLGASRIIKNFRHMITAFPPRWKIVGGALVRVPRWLQSTDAAVVTKGRGSIPNPDYQNPAVASVEGAYILTPWVFTEEILRPVNSAPGMNWQAQNYMGEWKFVTGNDAVLGMDDCAGVTDPLHELGRHFAQYKHAARPLFSDFGRVILFNRCANAIDCYACS
jgi:hypothetical protein